MPSKRRAPRPDNRTPSFRVEWPGEARRDRARRARSLPEVHLEVDLEPALVRDERLPVLRQLEALIRERQVVEIGDLLRLTAGALHGLAALGFTRVDHWEVEPGGWLPLPEPTHPGTIEPVGHMLRALEAGAWHHLAGARSFSVRLSGRPSFRIDLVVRRVHRERTHSLSLDLRGAMTHGDVEDVARALASRLPVLRAQATEGSEVRKGPAIRFLHRRDRAR